MSERLPEHLHPLSASLYLRSVSARSMESASYLPSRQQAGPPHREPCFRLLHFPPVSLFPNQSAFPVSRHRFSLFPAHLPLSGLTAQARLQEKPRYIFSSFFTLLQSFCRGPVLYPGTWRRHMATSAKRQKFPLTHLLYLAGFLLSSR